MDQELAEWESSSKSRNWCFTLNNYTDDEFKSLIEWSVPTWIVIGKEVGSNGTPHLQGYVRFSNAVRLKSLKAFNNRVHWGVARMGPEFNFNYCTKGGIANKERWDNIKSLAKENRLDEIDSEIYLKHYNTLKTIAKDHMERPDDLTEGKVGLWYWGKAGTGKTMSALREFPDSYRKCANNKWWDGYQGEDSVLIDDLDKSHEYMGFHLKIWADRYAFIAESKGSARYVRPKHVIVTSNWHPKDIWCVEQTLEPIMRRFKIVRFLSLTESVGMADFDEEVRPHYSVINDTDINELLF
ncbi:MAG: replication associated protein [Arizlama virus]|nr:MAG: replication associated protein [Arizlama virus]